MVTGVGSYLPINKCSNESLSNFLDTSDEWISYGMTTFAQGETSRNSSTERGGGEEALSEGEQPTT